MGDTVVIVNPNAQGGRIRRQIEAIRTTVAAHERVSRTSSRLHVSHGIAEAQHFLRGLPNDSKVIVAGGDGTVQHLLHVLVEKNHALGVLPLGSGNDGARALGSYNNDWRGTLSRLLASTHTRAVDLGVARFDGHETHFLVALNAGFDASIAQRALVGPKFLHGLPRYLLATLRELTQLKHWSLDIALDGQRILAGDALFASTLNAPTFGSGMPAVPHARCDDGTLNTLIARRFSRLGALLMLPRLLQGTHLADARVSTQAFRVLTLTSETPIPLAADGEFLGATRELAVSINVNMLRAVAP